MSSPAADYARGAALNDTLQHAPPPNPDLENIAQTLLIEDRTVMRILRGDFQEPLNQLAVIVADLHKHIGVLNTGAEQKELAKQILAGQNAEKILKLLETLNRRLGRYYHNLPYLLLLSPSTSTSNLPGKVVEAYCRRADVMIARDKFMRSDDPDKYEDMNFYDALLMKVKMKFHESEDGWKTRMIVEDKKVNQTTFVDASAPQRKKKWGIF